MEIGAGDRKRATEVRVACAPVPGPVPGLNEPKRRRLVLVEMSRATASPGWRGPCSGKWTFDSRRVAMWPGRVCEGWVGSAEVWDPGGPEAFQERGKFEQVWPWGLTLDNPSWVTISVCQATSELAWPVVRESGLV